MKRVSNRRKNQQRDRIQNKDRAERYGHFLFIGLENRADGGNGAAAANRRARRNQKGRIAAHLQELAERQTGQQRKGNSHRGVNESAAAGFQNFVQIHPEAERHHRTLQQCARNAAAFVDVRMREAETKKNSDGQSDRWGKQSRQGKRESENKNNFRERGHRLRKEYQVKAAESQRGVMLPKEIALSRIV